jgi:hypothetical protein
MNKKTHEQAPDTTEDKVRDREGNTVGGQEQPPSGLRPGEGRDAEDEDAGGVDKSM